MRGRQRGGSRTGTFLVLAGIAGVLTVTFVAGVWTGRNWPVIVGNPKSPVAAAEPPAKGRLATERVRPTEPLPPLTFYQDLKAPLTAPPPAPKPAKPPRLPELKREEPAPTAPALPPPAPSTPALPPPALPPAPVTGGTTRFTVQVAAYNAKPAAEALRSTLAAAGHEARIVEADQGVRFRVQVGTFPTKEAAREAAARLASERALPTFVTTR